MFRNLVVRTARLRGPALVALVLLITTAGSPALRDAAEIQSGRMLLTSESSLFRSGEWIHVQRNERGERLFEVELDGLVRQMGRRGGLVLDREGLARALQAVLGPDAVLEDMRVADLLKGARSVTVRFQGMSVPLGPPALKRLLSHFAGETPIEEMPLTELLDKVSGIEVTGRGAPGWLDEATLMSVFGPGLGRYQRVEHANDPERARRRELRRQYEEVESAVSRARRRLAGTRDVGKHLHEEAYDELAAKGQLDVAPLLDLHVELEQELERTTFKSMSLPDRIRNRMEVRRRIFGDDLTNLLFSRDEAIGQYDIGRLALEADQELPPAEKARRLQALRSTLKVQLAKQGVYVAFPDEAPVARRSLVRGTPKAAIDPAEDAGGPEEVRQ